VAACLILTGYVLYAQTASSRRSAKPLDAGEAESARVPERQLQLSEGKAIPGVEGSPIIAMPVQCSPDGVAFVEMPLASDFRQMRIASLEEKGGHVFTPATIPGLYDSVLLSFFPAESEVAFLVYATKDSKESEYSMGTDKGPVTGKAKLGAHQDFIALFDRKAAFESVIDLPAGYEYRKVAELDSGKFVLLAYNPVNRVVSLQLVSASGELLHPIQIPSGMLDDAKLSQAESGGFTEGVNASGSLSLWQFACARHKLILYKPHSSSLVLEVSTGGAIREVPLAAPAGYELDGVVSGMDRWIMRFRRHGLSDSQVSDASTASGNFLLYEIDPSDGSLRTRLNLATGSVFSLACEADNTITSFRVDRTAKFLVSSASLAR
jgi:hypothetical protein